MRPRFFCNLSSEADIQSLQISIPSFDDDLSHVITDTQLCTVAVYRSKPYPKTFKEFNIQINVFLLIEYFLFVLSLWDGLLSFVASLVLLVSCF